MKGIGTILVTTDFSDTSAKAFSATAMLATKFGARVIVLHVEDDRVPPLMVEYAAVGLEDIRKQQHDAAGKQLVEFAAKNLPGELTVELENRLGVPHAEIVRAAEEKEADLIVMATHGRGFISHAILGSTTERVVRRAPCPVFVVRDRHVGD